MEHNGHTDWEAFAHFIYGTRANVVSILGGAWHRKRQVL